jgi:hypothetical protein
MGQVQSTERVSITDEGELTDDEMNVASGGDNINHEVHAQGAPTARVAAQRHSRGGTDGRYRCPGFGYRWIDRGQHDLLCEKE